MLDHELTFDELLEIANSREACAKQTQEGGRLADAKEYALTAALAREVIEYREIYGALSERGFLTR